MTVMVQVAVPLPGVFAIEPVCETARSAEPVTVEQTVDALLLLFGSVVPEELTAAVLQSWLPFGALLASWTTRVNVAVAPDARLAAEQLTVLVPKQLNAGPVFWLNET